MSLQAAVVPYHDDVTKLKEWTSGRVPLQDESFENIRAVDYFFRTWHEIMTGMIASSDAAQTSTPKKIGRPSVCLMFDANQSIGLTMNTDLDQDPTGKVVVTNVVPGSSAEDLGVQLGAVLESVNGTSTEGLSQPEVKRVIIEAKS